LRRGREVFKQTLASQVLLGERSADEVAVVARQVARLTRAFSAVAGARLSKLDFLFSRARGELATLLRREQWPSPAHPTPRPFGEAPG